MMAPRLLHLLHLHLKDRGSQGGVRLSRTIPHRELRNNSSAILREVSQGATFQITNNGVVVAVLMPPAGPIRSPLRVRKALTKGGFADLVRAELDHPLQETLDDLRGDR